MMRPIGGADCSSALPGEKRVRTTTVDAYCREHKIETIDILKIDTKGTSDRVLRGAEGMLTDGRIKLVRAELYFMQFYRGQVDPLESISWMQDRGYQIVFLYDQHHRDNALRHLDLLYRYRLFAQ